MGYHFKQMKKLGWFAFFLVFFASCLDDPDCYQLHNDIVGVTFRVMGTGKGDSVLVKNFSTGQFEYWSIIPLSDKLFRRGRHL